MPSRAATSSTSRSPTRQAARTDYTANRYHQADDEWSADWDYAGQIQDLQVYWSLGHTLANSRDWPAWKEGSEFGPARAATCRRAELSFVSARGDRDGSHDETVMGARLRPPP